MEIEILDSVWSRIINKEDIESIEPCVTYKKDTMSAFDPYRCMINRGTGRFLTGLIPRIENYCNNKNIPCKVRQGNLEVLEPESEPNLPTITLRKDQIETINSIIDNQRGMIKNATGTGKTVLAGAVCSVWPSARVIFVCHTLDLLEQSKSAFINDFGFKNVFSVGGGEKSFSWPHEPTILIATMQTLKNFDILEHCDWADIIILDECHHLSHSEAIMAQILKKSMAPVKIGLSADLPKTEEGKFHLEGCIGPIIGEFTYQEAVKMGVLAKPLFNLIPVPYNEEISKITRYNDYKDENDNPMPGIYRRGIIENRSRNRIVLQQIINSINQGESVLVLTARDTRHGMILREMAKDIFDLDIPFVFGETTKEKRVEIKNQLEKKEIMAVLANVVWKEGINIKSLNHVINAGGEKFPNQIVGRGSRVTETKKWVKITDFLDPYVYYLSHHTVMRMIVYSEQGWLNFHDFYKK